VNLTKKSPYKRILLKISGEALMGELRVGLHPPTVNRIASQIKKFMKRALRFA
jgi:uridylate kinase